MSLYQKLKQTSLRPPHWHQYLVPYGVALAFLVLLSLALLPTFSHPVKAAATTYYIDYASGSDSYNGTSKATPWKHAPGMQGFSASYTHQAGDVFIFKGGVTWGETNWKMTVNGGGTNGDPDYYGVDKTWYTGSSWARPIFDAESASISGNGIMIQVEAGYVTFDNIEFRNLVSASSAATKYIGIDSQSNILVENCYFHAWDQVYFNISTISRNSSGVVTVTTAGANDFTTGMNLVVSGVTDNSFNTSCGNHCGSPTGSITVMSGTQFIYTSANMTAASSSGGIVSDTDQGMGVVTCGGTCTSNEVTNCLIENTSFSTVHNSGEVFQGINHIDHNTIHDVASVASGVNVFDDNLIYDVSYPTADFDASYHTDGAYQVYSGAIYNNVFYNYGANETALYPNPEGDNSTCTPNTVSIYNNVYFPLAAPDTVNMVDINDSYYTGAGGCDTINIYNNTLVANGLVDAVRVIGRGSGIANLNVENNHFINSTGAVELCFNMSGCGNAATVTNTNNIWQSTATATAQGYTTSEVYAYSPVSGGATIGAGANLTEVCSGNLAALCNDTTFGNSRTTVSRPASSAWDAGAYQYQTAPLANVYIAQTAQGSNNGTSCANAKAVSFFNTAGNWGTGTGQIGPGTTVHLCGVFSTATPNTSMLTLQGSGSSGLPITILFESGAQLNSPAWGANGAINLNDQNYITIDGGTNGLIQNTANGTSLTYHQASTMVYQPSISGSVHDIEIRNLTFTNNYVRVANTASDEAAAGGSGVIVLLSAGSNILIHNNTMTNCGNGGIGVSGSNTNSTNWQIYSNTISQASWLINVANVNSQTHYIFIHDNDLSNNDQYWDTTLVNCGDDCPYFHNNAIFLYGNPTGGATGTYGYAYIYNNYIHGALGVMTGFIFASLTTDGPIYVFNNVMKPTSTYTGGPSNLACNADGWVALPWQTLDVHVYNNTFNASAACGNSSPSPYNFGTRTTVSNASTLDWVNNINYYVSGHDIEDGAIGTSDYNVWYGISSGGEPQQAFKWNVSNAGWWYYYNTSCPRWTYSAAQNTSCGESGDPRPSAYDIHGVTGDPKLSTTDQLGAGSSAIGLGTNLTSVCNSDSNLAPLCLDKSGTARPASGAWDAGAYQYATSTDTTPPAVAWVSPALNATVSGTVTLTASSTDNVAVSTTSFYEGSFGSSLASSTLIGSTSTPSGTLYSIPWNTASLTNGSTTLWALSTDTSSNTTTASSTVNVENPPTISAVSTSTATSTATITWTTSHTASSQVNYGLTSGYGSSTATSTLVTSHLITLTNLTASTTYHYQILSTDAQGNPATTTDATFVTMALSSRTFYIDLVSGNDSQAGTKLAPWKHAPGMTGFSATYSHAAGDQFIFKGGQTCGSSGTPCFTSWTISNSGSAGAGHDYYGVDQTWYAGASWSKPVIDGGHKNPVVADPYIEITGSYVTMDSLRVQNIGVTPAENGGTGLNQGNYAVELTGGNHDILIENMVLPVESRIAIAFIESGTPNNIEIKGNDISACSWGLGGGGGVGTGFSFHDNVIHDFHDQMASGAHGDGLYIFGDATSYLVSPLIYNNWGYGDFSPSELGQRGRDDRVSVDFRRFREPVRVQQPLDGERHNRRNSTCVKLWRTRCKRTAQRLYLQQQHPAERGVVLRHFG